MRTPFVAALAAILAAPPVLADAPRVVTDIPAVHSLVAQVMGDRGAPVLLTERGADPHNMALRPSQAAALAEADLVFWIGPELTPWLDRALDGLQVRAHVVGLLAAEGTFRQDFGAAGAHGHDDHAGDTAEKGHAHGHAHGHGHGHAHGHAETAEDGHDHSGTDPHAWLDPANARAWLTLIAAELAEHAPDHAADYAANAAAAAAGIEALDTRIAATLKGLDDRPFVVFHDAYGYFTGHYGLTVAGSVALGDAAAPGAARLAALRDDLRAGGAVCAFPEAQHDPRLVATVVEGSGTRMGGTLDPSGTALEPGPGLYAALMTGLAETLAACLRG